MILISVFFPGAPLQDTAVLWSGQNLRGVGESTLSGSQWAETKQAVDTPMRPGAGASTGSYRTPLAMAISQKLTRLR